MLDPNPFDLQTAANENMKMVPFSRPIIIVTGKGGVGKSIAAACIAQKLSQEGRRILLVEFGPQSFYGPFFEIEGVGIQPKSLKLTDRELHISMWDVESSLRQYVVQYIKSDRLYDLFFSNKVMKTFVHAAPALSELALLGKLTSRQRNVGPAMDYDGIVVDAFSTGHLLALLRAPKGISDMIRFGPMGEQSARIDQVLRDSKTTEIVVTTTFEDLAVTESLELIREIQTEFSASPTIVGNRWVSVPFKFLNGSKDNSEFQKFLESYQMKSEIQNKNLKILKSVGGAMRLLPMDYRSESGRKMISHLAKEFMDPWTIS